MTERGNPAVTAEHLVNGVGPEADRCDSDVGAIERDGEEAIILEEGMPSWATCRASSLAAAVLTSLAPRLRYMPLDLSKYLTRNKPCNWRSMALLSVVWLNWR